MERDEMVKRSWKPYMEIHYQENRMPEAIVCLLTGIDFDSEIMTLQPLDEKFKNVDFPANIKYCSIPKKITALKIVKK